jgi:membrane protein YdbS with pleckstrin-like domain
MDRTILKEGPFVMVKNIIYAEIITSLLLFAFSFLGNYEELYRQTPIDEVFRYDLFLVIGFSILQVFIVLSIFLFWYRKRYEIRGRDIVITKGVFFKKETAVNGQRILSVSMHKTIFDRVMGHASISIDLTGLESILIRNVEYGDEYYHTLTRFVQSVSTRALERVKPVEMLAKEGEHSRLEFKQSFRWDIRGQKVSKEVERASMKTIVGFLNADGGTLVVGVTDNGKVVGIEPDVMSLGRKDIDGFENYITTVIKAMIGIKFRRFVSIRFEKVQDLTVCVINVEPANTAAYLRDNNKTEEFFVRTGNSTTPFSMSEAQDYIRHKWG